jgi:hypothetical protein
VGWEDAVNNGNFGYRAKSTGFDTSWYKTFTLISAGRYYINKGDQTAWNLLTTDAKYSGMEPFANIGCESCHGPATDHKSTMDKKKIGVSLDAGVCDQCHDAPNKHRLSSYWQASNHATFATTRTVSSTSCLPCHSGTGFYKAQNVKQGGDPTKNVITAADAQKRISCAACHDPHSTNNPKQLRTVTFDSLMNGYKPGTTGGMGQLCMNCHRSRYDVKVRVTNTPPYYGYSNRHYPHYSPQADMFFGQGGYEYGQTITARTTHAFVTNSCVTCHMATRTNGSSVHSNHEMKMDSAGVDIVTACLTCHPGITKFSDVIASSDYDGDGVKKGVALEIQSLLDKVKAKLPQGATGEPVTSINDTLKVKNHPEFVRSIWNYYAVKYDWSLGSHNAKYAAKLLQLSLADLTGVEFDSENIPQEYTLSQNYPNPFNPTTEIKFSVPQSGNVNLSVYNILGSLVKTLSDGELVAGEYRVKWNGTDRNNNPVASGIYLYRMTVSSGKGDFAVTKKMMLMR